MENDLVWLFSEKKSALEGIMRGGVGIRVLGSLDDTCVDPPLYSVAYLMLGCMLSCCSTFG